MLMVALLFVDPILSSFEEAAVFLAPDVDINFIFKQVAVVVSPVLAFITFLVLYRFIPNTEVKIKDVWLGALVASIVFDGAKWGFLYYIRTFPVYKRGVRLCRSGDGVVDLGICLGYHFIIRRSRDLALPGLFSEGGTGRVGH